MDSNIISLYHKNDSNRILQGDLLNDVKLPIAVPGKLEIIESNYLVVLSQDCDLNQDYGARLEIKNIDIDENPDKFSSLNNKLIPSVLLCPAYPAEQLRMGEHLQFLQLKLPVISKSTKTPWKKICQNETPRYHFLHEYEPFEIPDLVIDFKRFYTVSTEYLYNNYSNVYFASLNALYRENLSQRFANYLSRIGLPDLEEFSD